LEGKKPGNKLININGKIITKIEVKKDPACPCCNGNYEYLNGKNKKEFIKLCGTNNFQIRGEFNIKNLKNQLDKLDEVKSFNDYITFKNLFIFKDRIIIKANTKQEARTVYDKYLG